MAISWTRDLVYAVHGCGRMNDITSLVEIAPTMLSIATGGAQPWNADALAGIDPVNRVARRVAWARARAVGRYIPGRNGNPYAWRPATVAETLLGLVRR